MRHAHEIRKMERKISATYLRSKGEVQAIVAQMMKDKVFAQQTEQDFSTIKHDIVKMLEDRARNRLTSSDHLINELITQEIWEIVDHTINTYRVFLQAQAEGAIS